MAFAPVLALAVGRRNATRFLAPAFVAGLCWLAYFFATIGGPGDLFVFKGIFAFLEGPQAVLSRLFVFWPSLIFAESGRIVLSGAVFFCALQAFFVERPARLGEYVFPAAMIATQLVILGFFGHLLARYASLSVALVYALTAWALADVRVDWRVAAALFGIAAGLSAWSWKQPRFADDYAGDVAVYIEQIRTLQQAAHAIERDEPGAVVFTPWLFSVALRDARAGYVTQPIRTVIIRNRPFAPLKVPLRERRKALLLFSSPEDPPTSNYQFAGVLELRDRATGPCRSWQSPHTRFFLCPIN